jgi:molybdopterin converting factor subunit 1
MSEKPMVVCIRLFARAKDLVGADSIRLNVDECPTVGALRRRIAETHPVLTDLLPRSAIAVDEEFADDAMVLHPGMTIALIPPVSGG